MDCCGRIPAWLHRSGSIDYGKSGIGIDARIVGSLNRYHQFDRAFLPVEDRIGSRWQNVDRAFYEEISLPPVVLYKVGQVYFVVDGHHRVSVAREQGQEFIEAEVLPRYVAEQRWYADKGRKLVRDLWRQN